MLYRLLLYSGVSHGLPLKSCGLGLLLFVWFMSLSTNDFPTPNNEQKAILQTIFSSVFMRILCAHETDFRKSGVSWTFGLRLCT